MSESTASAGPAVEAASRSTPSLLPNALAERFLSTTLVFRFNQQDPLKQEPAKPSPDQLLPATRATVLQLFSGPDSGPDKEDAHRRRRFLHFLRTGCIGFFLMRGGQWSAYGWCSAPGQGHPPHLPRSASRLGAWWLFYAHTREEFRGQGLYKRLLAHVVQFIHAQQAKPLILVDTEIDNLASRRAILRSGFLPSGTFLTRRLWIPGLGALPLSGRWNRTAPHPPLTGSGS